MNKILFSIVVSLIVLGAIELVFSISGIPSDQSGGLYKDIYDAALELSPGVKLPLGNDPNFKLSVNRFGFRGPEINKQKDPGVYRIVCLGDSTTFGHFLPYEQSYCAKLQSLLADSARPGIRIESINAGIPGTAITQQLYLFENKVLDFKPDVAVLYAVPSMALEYIPVNDLRKKLESAQNESPHALKSFLRKFRIYRLMRKLIKGGIKKDTLSHMQMIRNSLTDSATIDAKLIEGYEYDLSLFSRTCQNNGIWGVVVQNAHLATAQRLAAQHAVPGSDAFRRFLSSPDATFMKITFERDDIAVVNPYSALVRQPDVKPLFFEDGVHPSQKGHDILAQIIADAIRLSPEFPGIK